MNPQDILKKMHADAGKAVEYAEKEFSTLHTGKASPSMVEGINVHVESYGSSMKIRDMAAVSTPDSRTITITPWDPSTLKDINKGIQEANLGFNPAIDGSVVRINVPELSRERRQELVKIASKMTEEARVSIRGVRREAMEALKAAEKNKEISEDERTRYEKDIQKETDNATERVNSDFANKEKELLQI